MGARFVAAIGAAALLATAHPAGAAPITYSETIEDSMFTTFSDLFDGTRDLTRTRTFGDGTSAIETDDAIIAGENVLSDNWGVSTALTPMTWQHVFDPLTAVETYLKATLTLEVIGVDADFPDLVFVEFFPVGALTVGGTDTQSTTTISTDGLFDPNAVIAFILADGKIDVMAWPLLLDFMTIRSSTLEVTYDPVPVPEPATAVLLLSGLAAGAWRRRHSAANRERRENAVGLT
jgi:hypothetical protein